MNVTFFIEETFLETEATAVLCAGDTNLIRGISCHNSDNSITVHCVHTIERLDKMNGETIWMLNKEMTKLNPEPYKSLDSDKSETIWRKA
jgi:hypothetical protein